MESLQIILIIMILMIWNLWKKENYNLKPHFTNSFLDYFLFARSWTSVKRDPSSPFLRAFWFFRIVCCHYVRRGVRPLYIAILGKIHICQVMGVSPFLLTEKRLATFSYASYLPLPSRSMRLLGIAPAGMIVSSNPPPMSRPRRSFHMVGLCRFCFIADPLGPLAAALLMERGLSSA